MDRKLLGNQGGLPNPYMQRNLGSPMGQNPNQGAPMDPSMYNPNYPQGFMPQQQQGYNQGYNQGEAVPPPPGNPPYVAPQSAGQYLRNQMAQSGVVGPADLHAHYREALRQAGVTKYGVLSVRPVVVNLLATLNSTTGSASADFRIPSEEVFIIREMRGILTPNDITGAGLGATFGSLVTLDFLNYVWLFAENCKVSVSRPDRGINVTLVNDLPLASIVPQIQGQPIRFDESYPGWVIPPADTVRMTASLTQYSTLSSAGQSWQYGVSLAGSAILVG